MTMGRLAQMLGLWAASVVITGAIVWAAIAASQQRIGALEAQSLAGQAQDYAAEARWDSAIHAYKEALRYQPANTAWALSLARLSFRTGRFAQAAAFAAQSLQSASDSALLRDSAVLLASIHLAQAHPEKARAVLDPLPFEVRRLPEVQTLLAHACEAMANYPAMAEALRRIAEGPLEQCSVAYRASFRARQQRIANLRSRMDADSPNAYDAYRLAIEMMHAGVWEGSIALLRSLARHPDAPGDAFYWLGAHAEALGAPAKAAAYYADALARTPSHRRAAARRSALAGTAP